MIKGRGVGVAATPHPKGFFSFSRERGEEIFYSKLIFLAVDSSSEYLSMKKFQIGAAFLALRLDEERVLEGVGGGATSSNNEDAIQS